MGSLNTPTVIGIESWMRDISKRITQLERHMPTRLSTGGDEPVAMGTIAVVFNGSNTSTARPDVTIVMWVGVAVPSNMRAFDFRYPANLP